MVEVVVASSKRYIYLHDVPRAPNAVDTHHIVVRRNVAKRFAIFIAAGLIVVYPLLLFLVKGTSIPVIIWCLLTGALLVKLFIWNSIKKESVIIIPAFGIQLETHYGSGRIKRCFIPVNKILKPVLSECVTPVTCYWCLSLLAREEEELMLVFKQLRPPMKMLVPIWKALCAATDYEESCKSHDEPKEEG